MSKITIYNKLVRDKIPDIIEQSGKKANYHSLDYKEFQHALKVKLVEEANELLNAKTPKEELEELADIYEIIMFFTHDPSEVKMAAFKKRKERGWFAKHIFLESVEEDD